MIRFMAVYIVIIGLALKHEVRMLRFRANFKNDLYYFAAHAPSS